MESASAGIPPPAARLSEEAMDLVCSFVREESDYLMTETLRALALVSHRWTSSAIRALWYDPSRAFNWRQSVPQLLRLLLTKPHRTRYIRSLSGLNRLSYGGNYDRYSPWDDQSDAEIRILTILSCCKELHTLSLPENLPLNRYSDFKPFARIRHLILDASSGAFTTLPKDAWQGLLPSLDEVTLTGDDFYVQQFLQDYLLPLPFRRLNLDLRHWASDCLLANLDASKTKHLRYLVLQQYGDLGEYLQNIPLDLRSLTLQNRRPFATPSYSGGEEGGPDKRPFLPDHLPQHLNLTSLTYPSLHLFLHDLPNVATAFPSLKHLEFSDSTWGREEWIAPSFAVAFQALTTFVRSLPSLNFLSIGYLPLFWTYWDSRSDDGGAAFDAFNDLADERGLDLRYKVPPEGEPSCFSSEQEDDSSSDGIEEQDSSTDKKDEEEKPIHWEEAWLSDEPETLTPPTSPSPSPSPPFLFRLLDERIYVDEPPVEPRVEAAFQVEDVEVEEDKEEEDEPYARWETDEDVVEADRRWRAFEPECE